MKYRFDWVLVLFVLIMPSVSYAQEVDTTKEWALVGQLDDFGEVTRYLKVHSADTVHSSDSTAERPGYATIFEDKGKISFTVTRFETTEDVSQGTWYMNTKVMIKDKPMYKRMRLSNNYKLLSLSKEDTLYLRQHLMSAQDVKCSVSQIGSLGQQVKMTITSKGFKSPRKK